MVAARAPVRRLPLGLPLLYFAVRIAFADHALALTQRDLAAGNLAAAAAHYEASGQTSDLWYSRALLAVGAESAHDRRCDSQAFAMAAAAGGARHAHRGRSVQRLVQPVLDPRRAK